MRLDETRNTANKEHVVKNLSNTKNLTFVQCLIYHVKLMLLTSIPLSTVHVNLPETEINRFKMIYNH